MNITENKAERALRDRAFALADSGKYDSTAGIQRELVSEGWPNVSRVMDSEIFRQALHDRCNASAQQA